MATRRTPQEWQTLLALYENSQLTQRVFCEKHSLGLSTFYSKRQQYQMTTPSNISAFVKAEIVEKTTTYQTSSNPVADLTLSIHAVTLRIPQGTPVSYLAELIKALS